MNEPLIERINQKYMKGPHKTVVPVDAATIILLDRRFEEPRMLMGRRNAAAKFMPGVFVFPGGRVEPQDGDVPHAGALHPSDLEKLALHASRLSRRRLKGLALAAIRETFEETGLRIGVPHQDAATHAGKWRADTWEEFFQHGIIPNIEGLHFLARAITPPGRSRRFDTRFFVLDISDYADQVVDRTTPDSELVELRWLTIDEAIGLDVVEITQIILKDLKYQAAQGFAKTIARPLYRTRNGRFDLVRL